MWLPKLKETKRERTMISAFGGYNHNLRIGENEFFDMQNMTGDFYPIASVREKRQLQVSNVKTQGILLKDGLWYVEDGNLIHAAGYIHDVYPLNLGTGRKQLVSFGAYILIFPNQVYVNTANTMESENYGSMVAEIRDNNWSMAPCDYEGNEITIKYTGGEDPTDMADGDYWYDTSGNEICLRKYDGQNREWKAVDGYVRMRMVFKLTRDKTFTDVFSSFDSVDITVINGGSDPNDFKLLNLISGEVDDLDDDLLISAIRNLRGEDLSMRILDERTVVIPGLLPSSWSIGNTVSFRRTLPVMDFVFECGNRLWGCRYGSESEGEIVNEIYASALGDFGNFKNFKGVSTDAYIASVGTDGPFTGAINYNGYPLFFKADHLHRVYGSYPAQYQIQDMPCHGVKSGCGESLVMLNGNAFYLGDDGVYVYDGAVPSKISDALGRQSLSAGKGGFCRDKYYLAAQDEDSNLLLFVYSTRNGLWHKEDDLPVLSFESSNSDLYAEVADGENTKIITMAISEAGQSYEDDVPWMVETGQIGLDSPDRKYISGLTVRMLADMDTVIRFYVQYDFSHDWEMVYSMTADRLRSFAIPLRPRRCDFMKLRIEGIGEAKIYSITKTVMQGGERS